MVLSSIWSLKNFFARYPTIIKIYILKIEKIIVLMGGIVI